MLLSHGEVGRGELELDFRRSTGSDADALESEELLEFDRNTVAQRGAECVCLGLGVRKDNLVAIDLADVLDCDLRKTPLFLKIFLGLFRACFGKKIVFYVNMAPKWRFFTL
jgi:hypothetical protein